MSSWYLQEKDLALHYLGRILHPLQDSYSRSHASRALVEGDIPHIYQFYTMDDVDWRKHGAADKPPDNDEMFRAAKYATSKVLARFGEWVEDMSAKIANAETAEKNIIDQIGGAQLFDVGLKRFLGTLCELYKIEERDLYKAAGGSGNLLSLSGRSWKPETMPENLAEEYRYRKGIYDYPTKDDLCAAPEISDPTLPPQYGTYTRETKSPVAFQFVLPGDGLGVSKSHPIDLTCSGLGADPTITLQDVHFAPSLKEDDLGKSELRATRRAWWQLYT